MGFWAKLFCREKKTNGKQYNEVCEDGYPNVSAVTKKSMRSKSSGSSKQQAHNLSDLVNYRGVRNLYKTPYDFDSYSMRSHLKMWIHVNFITEEYLVDNVDLSDNLKTLSFYTEEHSKEFMEWFEAYLSNFKDYADAYFRKYPGLKEGHQEGYFCYLDYDDDRPQPCSTQKNQSAFDRATEISSQQDEDWLWILRHTQGAFWTGTGWLFKDRIDYAAYKLMQQQN